MRVAARVVTTAAVERRVRRILGLSSAVWRDALLAWAAQRALLVALLLLWRTIVLHNVGGSWLQAVYKPLTDYDSNWYFSIAVGGYSRLPQASFLPLYPLLEHLVTPLTLGHAMLAGLLVANAAGLVAFALLRRLVEDDVSVAGARRTLYISGFFATSFYLAMAYTESLFLALSLGAFLAIRHRRWLLAGVLIALAALTRSTGVLLLLPYGLQALAALREREAAGWREREAWRWGVRVAGCAALPLAALAAWYVAIDLHFGTGGAIGRALNAPEWQRHLDWPWYGLLYSLAVLAHGGKANEVFDLTRDLVFALFWIGCTVALFWRKWALPRDYAVYTLATLVLTLSFPMHANPYDALSSMPRYLLDTFPCFVLLAKWSQTSRAATWVIGGISAVLLILFVGMLADGAFIA